MDSQNENIDERLLSNSEKSSDDLVEKYKALEEFVYSLCHDLKTPVVSILGLADIIENESYDRLSKDSQYYLKRIQENTRNIIERIDQILIFSQEGVLQKTEIITDLNSVVRRSISNFLPIIKTRKIDITVLESHLQVKIDLNDIIFVFDNLIGNSIKYMGNQTQPSITVGIQKDKEKYVTTYVKDNGIGIPNESLPQIFQMFSRASNVPTEITGTGIGLARVKKIINSYGGKIWLESVEGEGTTVFFSLPIHSD